MTIKQLSPLYRRSLRLNKSRVVALLVLSAAVISGAWPVSGFPASEPRLGTALNFAALAGSTITNTGPSVITGNAGLHPGSSVTGFPPGSVTGVTHVRDKVALLAKDDLVTAYTDAAQAPSTSNLTGQDLGGLTLDPGVYTFDTSAQLTGTLTLRGNGVFIFQIGSTLTTASSAVVSVLNGAQPCGIYWQVGSSATLGSGTLFQGNLMALTSITMVTGANILQGRALARNGALTLDTNNITPPVGTCTAAAAASPTPSVGTSSTPSGGGTPSPASTAPAGGASPTPAVVGGSPTPALAVPGTTIPGGPSVSTTPTAPATPAPGVPNTGRPPDQPGFSWWPLAAALTIGASLLLAVRLRTYLRD